MPIRVGDSPGVHASQVPQDLVNYGSVQHSLPFPAARIGAGAGVRRSVVPPGGVVPAGADINSAVV